VTVGWKNGWLVGFSTGSSTVPVVNITNQQELGLLPTFELATFNRHLEPRTAFSVSRDKCKPWKVEGCEG
jgi:hypothetical protein